MAQILNHSPDEDQSRRGKDYLVAGKWSEKERRGTRETWVEGLSVWESEKKKEGATQEWNAFRLA